MVDRMEACIPDMIDAQLEKADLPDTPEMRANVEKMKKDLLVTMEESTSDARESCKDAEGKSANDGDKVRACLLEPKCRDFNACITAM